MGLWVPRWSGRGLEDSVLETRSVDDSCNRRLEQHETLNIKQRWEGPTTIEPDCGYRGGLEDFKTELETRANKDSVTEIYNS